MLRLARVGNDLLHHGRRRRRRRPPGRPHHLADAALELEGGLDLGHDVLQGRLLVLDGRLALPGLPPHLAVQFAAGGLQLLLAAQADAEFSEILKKKSD